MVQLVRFLNPRAMPRRCSRRPLTAWRGAVGGARSIEVGQDVGAPLGQGPGQLGDLLQPGRDGLPQGADEPLHQELPRARVLGAVGPGSGAGGRPGWP